MNYTEGAEHMLALSNKLDIGQRDHFMVGNLRIDYPGYKTKGDYRLSIPGGIAPKHTDVVNLLNTKANHTNANDLIAALESLYLNGLDCNHPTLTQNEKELIYWITLQEEINYPQPRYAGRKLSFQRYYEGILAKLGFCQLMDVHNRTNNHSRQRPTLYQNIDYKVPVFSL